MFEIHSTFSKITVTTLDILNNLWCFTHKSACWGAHCKHNHCSDYAFHCAWSTTLLRDM